MRRPAFLAKSVIGVYSLLWLIAALPANAQAPDAGTSTPASPVTDAAAPKPVPAASDKADAGTDDAGQPPLDFTKPVPIDALSATIDGIHYIGRVDHYRSIRLDAPDRFHPRKTMVARFAQKLASPQEASCIHEVILRLAAALADGNTENDFRHSFNNNEVVILLVQNMLKDAAPVAFPSGPRRKPKDRMIVDVVLHRDTSDPADIEYDCGSNVATQDLTKKLQEFAQGNK